MNWISQWLNQGCEKSNDCDHCFRYCSRRQMLADKIGSSPGLIYILQYEHGAVTHPTFADRIADLLHAAPEQRDSIVHAKHRGTYTPGCAKPLPKPEEQPPQHKRPVVAVNCICEVVNRFDSIKDAYQRYNCTEAVVYKRVHRKLKPRTDEFMAYGITFRFADEWDAMTPEERAKDVYRQYGDIVYGKHETPIHRRNYPDRDSARKGASKT